MPVACSMIGKKFGKLTVVALAAGRGKLGESRRWICKCDCGGKSITTTGNLNGGHTKTCGCLHDRVGGNHPNWRGCGEISAMKWKQYELMAKARKFEFNITIEFGWELFLKQKRLCALSGVLLLFGKSVAEARLTTASLDRINSKIGYIKDNVQWVHKDINVMKMDLDESKFIELCKNVAIFRR